MAARAEPFLGEFLDKYQSGNAAIRQQLEDMLSLNENGMSWSNILLEDRHQPLLYCTPETLALTGGQLADMLVREAKQFPKLRNAPYGDALLLTLMATFPCRAK